MQRLPVPLIHSPDAGLLQERGSTLADALSFLPGTTRCPQLPRASCPVRACPPPGPLPPLPPEMAAVLSLGDRALEVGCTPLDLTPWRPVACVVSGVRHRPQFVRLLACREPAAVITGDWAELPRRS